jgi:peptidyl-prolyl cis-trans isomerase D
MLSGIRSAAGTWLGKAVLVVLFGFLIVSFAIWGIGDIFRGGPQTTVARVGGTEIGTEAFRRAFQNRVIEVQQQSRGFTTEQARQLGLDRQVLNQMLGDAALSEAGKSLGLALTDEEVARTLAAETAFRGPDGRFNRQAFDAYLRNEQLSEGQFIQQHKRTMIRQHIVLGLGGGYATPSAILEAVHRWRAEERSIEYLVVPGSIATAIPLPDESVLRALHDQRKASFRAPEYRAFNKLAVLPEAFANQITVTDQELQAGYERMLAAGQLGAPERRQVQQVVFPNAAEAAAAKAKIDGGMTFEALIADMKLKPEDVDLGLKTRGELVDQAVANAAFGLAEGVVSSPVQGQFGSVLVRVVKMEPSTAPALAAITDTVRSSVLASKLTSDRTVRDKVNQLHDKVEELRASGKSLEQTAGELKLELVKVTAADAEGRDKAGEPVSLPDQQEVLRAVFASDRGVDNEAIKTRSNGWIWFEVTGIERSRERSFDEVKAEVGAAWQREEALKQTQARAADLLKKLEGGAKLEDAATEEGLNIERVDGVTRSGKDAISQGAAALAFTLEDGKFAVAPAAQGADRLIIRVVGKEVPAFDAAATDTAALKRRLDSALADEILQQYVERLKNALGASVNERALALATGAQTQR